LYSGICLSKEAPSCIIYTENRDFHSLGLCPIARDLAIRDPGFQKWRIGAVPDDLAPGAVHGTCLDESLDILVICGLTSLAEVLGGQIVGM